MLNKPFKNHVTKRRDRDPESSERDRRVLALHDQLIEIEQRLIPTGLHVFGRPSLGKEKLDLLKMVASFDRPEAGARALTDLVSEGLRVQEQKETRRANARVDKVVSEAIETFLQGGAAAAEKLLLDEANVSLADARPVFELLDGIVKQLERNSEIEALGRALRAEYIEPGPGADIVQNPQVLPTGRNTHAINPYSIPSVTAFARAETVATALLSRYKREHGRYPRSMALVLWGLDNIKT
ncbi:MAG TPA: cobaltochelatase subunit CobN, partial [Pyrinomonadaceae bacterium]